jgi:Subtilase family/Calx-beta domain
MARRGALRAREGGRLIAAILAWSLSFWGVPLAAAGPTAGRPGPSGAPGAVAHDGNIFLNVGAIATGSAEADALRAPVGPFEGKRLHLVQFAGPIRPEWYAALRATGARVVQYVPSYAYLVYGDASALGRVQLLAQSSPAVRRDGAYLDRYKVQPAAQAETRARLGLTAEEDSFAIQLVADAKANEETLRLVKALGRGAVQQDWEVSGYRDLVAQLPVEAVASIAARPDVVSIDRHVTPELFDERQDRIVTGQMTGNGPTPGDHLAYLAAQGFTQAQFDASGFVVDVTDSGIDNGTTSPNHFGLRAGGSLAGASRVRYNRLVGTPHAGSTLQGCDGHGTLNSHIVAGYVPDPASLPSPGAHRDGSSFRYGLGVCPFVKVGSSVIFDPYSYTNPNLPNLQSRAYNDDARVSTNSWGANTGGAYTVEAQTFDALVRDAQPATAIIPAAGNQQMVVVFSAGNSGSGPGTVGSPGVAKNVITVGASEGVQAFGGADLCGVPDASADSANDVAFFSSRGPTDDGRFKPDVVAPGTHVSGGVFQATASVAGTGAAGACFDGSGVCGGVGQSFFPAGQQFYSASSGTSHSAPAVAGGAALVRQHFVNDGLAPPSPAMTKAVLVNSARYMIGAGANDTLPSNSQGMGMMNLDAYFSQMAGPHLVLDQRADDLFTASGEQRVVTGTVASSAQPFRVTLAWTDPPGATFGVTSVNDLDLEVSVGGVLYRGNVFSGSTSTTGGTADPRNNVESVFLPAGLSGAFAVRVVATNIAGDGVPGNGTPLDQDFALVISNADVAPRPVVVAATGSVVADSCSGDGRLDPGESAALSLCLQNTGTSHAASAVATLQASGGVTSPNGPQSYGLLAAGGAAVCRTFDFVVGSLSCGASLTATVHVQDGAQDLGDVSWVFPTGTPVVAAAQAFDGVAPPALPAGWATTSESGASAWTTVSSSSDTPPNSAFLTDPATVSLTSLESPDVAVPATAGPIVLTFRHSYGLEPGYDGGVLELKVGGAAFQDVLSAGGSFEAGGYDDTLSTVYSNPLGGRQAWTGITGGYVTTTVDLPASVSGQTIRLRWRLGSDVGIGDTGWLVDSISLRAGSTCCVPTQPSLSVDDVSVVEGDAGTTMASFTVSLWPAAGGTVTVDCATADGTATVADGDYVAEARSLTFAPGVTSQPFTVTVNGDTAIEPSETFSVNLANPSGAPIGKAQGVGTITDDDTPMPCVSFSLSPTSASPDAQAGSQLVTIAGSPDGCETGEWTATGNETWLTVSPSAGTGPGSTTVSWSENTGVPRTDAATIAGRPFTVTQASPARDFFTVVPPCRLVDTREPGPSSGTIPFATSRVFPVVGGACTAVPASATAVAFNVTITGPTATGNCRLYPGPSMPQASTLNFSAGQTRANNAVVPLGAGGTVTVYCSGGTAGSVHLILDVSGYFE